MRLLRLEDDDKLSLTELVGNNIPRYGILSHTWGADDEEVTFKDLVKGKGKNKPGYGKILFCGKQAAKDGLQYFWVDTCCIDKTSSAELSEAINSMWRWYQNSEVCYAYLTDVPANTNAVGDDTPFTKSKWFTRGWTLQELLAPAKIILFNTAWEFIGTKDELAGEISRITGIDKYYLGTDTSKLERASIAERMCWASARKTTREEDIAYCLLGIFNINMPLLYGEGTKAFRRLQEEIMKQSDDQSIFAWGYPSFSSRGGLLAQLPANFSGCKNIVRSVNPRPVKPYAITNRGLQIEFPLLKLKEGIFAGLNCRLGDNFFADLALPLYKEGKDNQYQRDKGEIRAIPITNWRRAQIQSMYIRIAPEKSASRSDPKDHSFLIRDLPPDYVVSQVFPPDSWSPRTRAIEANLQQDSLKGLRNQGLVLVTSRPPNRFLLMLCHRRSRVFGTWFPEARILPISIDKSEEIAELFSYWESRDLLTLPRAQKSDFGVIVLRAVPEVIRGKSFIVIDVIVSSDGYYLALEATERMTSFLRFISYQLTLVYDWVLKRKVLITDLLIRLFTLLLVHLLILVLVLLLLLLPLSFWVWWIGKYREIPLNPFPLEMFFSYRTPYLNLYI